MRCPYLTQVVQYRCQYGIEQWLVKWKDYGEDRNTWEPWDNFLNDEMRSEARAARTAALPRTEASGDTLEACSGDAQGRTRAEGLGFLWPESRSRLSLVGSSAL